MTTPNVWPPPVGPRWVALRWAYRYVGTGRDYGPERSTVEWQWWPADTPALRAAVTSPFVEVWAPVDWGALLL
jgi:hypothetical protein